jgi:hypothetical protein
MLITGVLLIGYVASNGIMEYLDKGEQKPHSKYNNYRETEYDEAGIELNQYNGMGYEKAAEIKRENGLNKRFTQPYFHTCQDMDESSQFQPANFR